MPNHASLDVTHGRPAIVTGQQAGLLGGPLFTLGKLLGAVALARSTGAVPVFWIECDDADIKEVDQVRLVDEDGSLRTFTLDLADDLRPVAARTLPEGIVKLLDDVEALLPAGPFRDETMAGLRGAYKPGVGWAEAFRVALASLVPDAGVVFFDPTTAEAKEAARPVFARVIEDADAVEAALRAGATLVADPQVPYIEGELPLFVLDPDGKRRKIERRGGGAGSAADFALKGTDITHTRASLLALLDKEPTRFSPGVLLRPLVQDTLLPTAAYVAGPAEARYHAELPPLYALFARAQPRIVDRPRLVVLDPRARRALAKLGASPAEAAEDPEALRARAARVKAGVDPTPAAEGALAAMRTALDVLRKELEPLDPAGLPKAFGEADAAIAYHLQKLAKRASVALERKDADAAAHAGKLATLLRPGGEPQERVLPAAAFLARFGRAALVGAIERQIDVSELGRTLVIDLTS